MQKELETNKLSILCFGAGAIGAYIGGSLALAGHQVVFVERQDVIDTLAKNGLILELIGTTHHLEKIHLVSSIIEAVEPNHYDFAIFALKSYDTESMLDLLKSNADLLPPVLCLQNGVENEQRLIEALGSDRVIAGTVTSAIGRPDIGHIILEKLRGIGIASNHPLSAQIVRAMTEAGLKAELFADARSMKWSKLLTNLPANASSAILNMTAAQIFANPDLFHIEILQLRETLEVMKAQGISVVDLPGTPVRLFAFAIRWLPEIISRPLLSRAIGSGRGDKMPSFHIDLHNGRGKSEVEYLNGAVAKYGGQCGINTPINKKLTTTLQALTTGNLPIDTFSQSPERYVRVISEKSKL